MTTPEEMGNAARSADRLLEVLYRELALNPEWSSEIDQHYREARALLEPFAYPSDQEVSKGVGE